MRVLISTCSGLSGCRRAKLSNCDVSEAALTEIAKAGFDPVYGARPLKRAIQSELENALAKEILSGRFGPKDTIVADVKNGRFFFGKGAAGEHKKAA